MLKWLTRRTPTPASPSREVFVENGLAWLATTQERGAIVTALAVGEPVDRWEAWLAQVVAVALGVGNPAIFYLEDWRTRGYVISSAERALHVARHVAGVPLVWHAIARKRKGFAHILAFGIGLPPQAGQVLEDGNVIEDDGPGLVAVRAMVELAKRHAELVIDPFCGAGTVLAVAGALGLRSIGVDTRADLVAKAKALKLEPKSKRTAGQ